MQSAILRIGYPTSPNYVSDSGSGSATAFLTNDGLFFYYNADISSYFPTGSTITGDFLMRACVS